AVGETRISGLLEGEDVLNTGKAMVALGASVERLGAGEWRVYGGGGGGFCEPAGGLDFRNFATRCRLVGGGRGRLPNRRHLRWRRLAAQAADAAHHRPSH